MSSSKRPVTKADAKMANAHLHKTERFAAQKAKEHRAAASRTSNAESKAYNRAHAKEHEKEAAKARKGYKSNYVKGKVS